MLRLQPAAVFLKLAAFAADQLQVLIDRIERLEEGKPGIDSDVKDIYAEAKGNRYDVATLKKVIKLSAMDASERAEADYRLDTYCAALGMKPQLDLFEKPSTSKTDEADELYENAVQIVRRDQKPSASYIQRMLRLGYIVQPGFESRPVPRRRRGRSTMTGMMADEEITTRTRQVIGDNLGFDERTVMPESRFVEDLGADSLDLVELMMALEVEFGGTVEDDEAEKVHTLQDAVALIKKKKGIKE